MFFRILSLALLTTILVSASECNKNSSRKTLAKIEFDYSGLDEAGRLHGVTPLDYEFCIPREEDKVEQIKSIEPLVNIPQMAKGRIRCSDDEYLCIVSTNHPDWKERLYAIASLPYVKRIIQTYYE